MKIVQRWSKKYLKSLGLKPATDNENDNSFWRFLLKTQDGLFCFSVDGETPNNRNKNKYLKNGGFFNPCHALFYDHQKWMDFFQNIHLYTDESLTIKQDSCKCDPQDLLWFGHATECKHHNKK